MARATEFKDILRRKLIFLQGKGGVGKSVCAEALARSLAASERRTLWVTIEDADGNSGDVERLNAKLDYLNCRAIPAMEEYALLKLKVGALAKLFSRNPLIQYLGQAAPGFHELIILGKIWHERENYQHVVVDMPSTGYGLAMFHSVRNFAKLFASGPVHRDALAMWETLASPDETGNLIITLPEEMPISESIELGEKLHELFPKNPGGYVVNRCFPQVSGARESDVLISRDGMEYARSRAAIEERNIAELLEAGAKPVLLPWVRSEEVDATEHGYEIITGLEAAFKAEVSR